MKRLFTCGAVILLPLLLTACAPHGDVHDRFVAEPPDGWILAADDQHGTKIYIPQGQNLNSDTMRFVTNEDRERFIPNVRSYATSFLDAGRQVCPDVFEDRAPAANEHGYPVVNTVFYCPYTEQTGQGSVLVKKFIQGKEGIYTAEFTIRTKRFNPGDKPADVDVVSWQKRLEAVRICKPDHCD